MDNSSQSENARATASGHADPVDGAGPFPGAQGDLSLPKVQSDDSPTIISKNHPITSEPAKQTPRESLGSLRGRKLAHFELIEPIGVGGMAAVIRARDTQLDRFVALKILPPEMAADEENIRRFNQEARAAAKLDHENIARVFFCGEDQRLHFIAFEFVEGENLRNILERRGKLPVAEAVRYVLQIATGLEHAASRGVVHRDIKPSNIIITPSGKAKLVDMGLARSQDPQAGEQLTQSGVTLGTFDYISPEQALEPREADSRSDLYSLGCTFYHMLTGRPPVPDGTAAKKLHHHQHVAPLDPRQVNPSIPDEVAVIMSRMMAKEPGERYQRPIYLVQHLMQIAQKVGAAADLPEGGLIVEAPLPTEPRKRPLLLVSIGALVLSVQIFLVTLFTQPDGSPPANGGGGAVATDKKERVKDKPNGTKVVGSEATPAVVKTQADLEKVFADGSATVRATLKGKIDLGEYGLTYVGDGTRTLELKAIDEPATIRFKLPATEELPVLLAGLTIEGGHVIIENVKFEIEADPTPPFPFAALAVRSGAKVTLRKCTFIQKDVYQGPPGADRVPVASVLVDNSGGSVGNRPSVILEQCYFHGATTGGGQAVGQVAIAVNGPADLVVTNGAFKPHGSLFHLRGSNKDFDTSIRMSKCSAFVHHGPAFRIDDEAKTTLNIAYSIFSGPGKLNPWSEGSPHFILQTSNKTKETLVRYEGQRNCFHNLWDMLVVGAGAGIYSNLEEFNAQVVSAGGGGDADSSYMKDAPTIWESPAPLKEEFPTGAFALRADMAQVRTTNLKQALGVEKLPLPWGVLPQPAYAPKEIDLAARPGPFERWVDPDDTTGGKNIFTTLDEALGSAKSGEPCTIFIKQPKSGREIEVGTFRFHKPGIDVTLKPFAKDQPILTMGITSESDAAFFRIHDGKLHIEDLDFVLEPDQDNFKYQSLVLLADNVSFGMKNCIITLRQENKKITKLVPVSVISLLEPEDSMVKMMPKASRSAPLIQIDDCYVRGKGDLLSVRSSRPFDLTVNNSVLCLWGSLLHVHCATKEVSPDLASSVKLTSVSTFTNDAMIALRGARNSKTYVPLKVDAIKGLFVAPDDKPLIAVDSPETSDEGLRVLFEWKGEGNAYANFTGRSVLESSHLDDPLPRIRLEKTDWERYETGSQFPRTTFVLERDVRRVPWLVLPEQLRPRAEIAGEFEAGATLPAGLLGRLPAMRKDAGPVMTP